MERLPTKKRILERSKGRIYRLVKLKTSSPASAVKFTNTSGAKLNTPLCPFEVLVKCEGN